MQSVWSILVGVVTWILAAHLSVDINVHCAHDERGQGCEDDVVQGHVEVCNMNKQQ